MSSISSAIGFYRPTWLEISLGLLEQNLLKLKSFLVSSKTQVLAVVKADGYGHGAQVLAGRLEALGVSWFGVSSVEEGIALRTGGIKGRILILGSLYPFAESFEGVLNYDLTPTISSPEGAGELLDVLKGKALECRVHIKMETGMQRIGARPQTCLKIAQMFQGSDKVRLEGLYTHFASAKDEAYTNEQLGVFARGIELLAAAGIKPRFIHSANSTAAVRWPQTHFDLVRSGLALYGELPGFEPIVELKTRVVFLKKIPSGTSVSYGRTYSARRETLLATLPIGYGDGLPPGASRGAQVVIEGARAPVAGVITMDMMMADVTDIAGVHVGSEALVMGPGARGSPAGQLAGPCNSKGSPRNGGGGVTPGDWAHWSKTSVYDILCGLGAQRLPKVYVA